MLAVNGTVRKPQLGHAPMLDTGNFKHLAFNTAKRIGSGEFWLCWRRSLAPRHLDRRWANGSKIMRARLIFTEPRPDAHLQIARIGAAAIDVDAKDAMRRRGDTKLFSRIAARLNSPNYFGVMQQFGRYRRGSGHDADIAERPTLTVIGSARNVLECRLLCNTRRTQTLDISVA
jgi:hypothetical protein